jgi:restriction system protein
MKEMETPRVWCVRAHGGQGTEHFVRDGFVGLAGDLPDLSAVTSRADIEAVYRGKHPEETSPYVIGQSVGIIERFRFGIRQGDIVITPDREGRLRTGTVKTGEYRFVEGERYRHRYDVEWHETELNRAELSVPLQATLRSAQTVFEIDPPDEILRVLRRPVAQRVAEPLDWREVVLSRVLALDAREFELLSGELLRALGFEATEVVGGPGDGGVDAVGVLDVSGLARINVFVQAKRYRRGSRISANTVKALRASIPRDGQGAFITTADFERAAYDLALDPGFPRIGLINGERLVELLVAHWADLPEELRQKLGLQPGLVPLVG